MVKELSESVKDEVDKALKEAKQCESCGFSGVHGVESKFVMAITQSNPSGMSVSYVAHVCKGCMIESESANEINCFVFEKE